MELSGVQKSQLSKALRHAFPEKADLAQMVAFGLDTNLSDIVRDGDLASAVFDLIRWAIAHGQEEALIRAALAENPTNPLLCAFAITVGMGNEDVKSPAPISENRQASSAIIITRLRQFKLVHADCSIYIDDKQVGEIEVDQIKQFDVTPGFHGVRILAQFLGVQKYSQPLTFTLTPRQTIHLQCSYDNVRGGVKIEVYNS